MGIDSILVSFGLHTTFLKVAGREEDVLPRNKTGRRSGERKTKKEED